MTKACIFDLDGTLTDTLDSLTYSVNAMLREMKLPEISREKCREYVGNGVQVLIQKTLKFVGDTELKRWDEAMDIFTPIFDANCTYKVVPYDGILSLLEALRSSGIALAVSSNKPHAQAVRIVESVFGTDTFQFVQGQKEDVPRKPDPTSALDIAEALGALPEETVYIGDSEVDIATGTAAGMRTISVTWGFRSVEQLKEAGAKELVNSPAEILTKVL